MRITAENLQYWIDNFYGFGNWSAPVWFISHEEGGGDLPEEVAEKFEYFDQTHKNANDQLTDLRDLYRHVGFRVDGPRAKVFDSMFDYRFGPEAKLHGLWKNLIAFAHGYRAEKTPDLLYYQKQSFALKAEALIPLYPLPSPHDHAWYYSWLDLPQKKFLTTRKMYEEHFYAQRIDAILRKITLHRPSVVMMYGMNNINMLKASISEFFADAKFKMTKSVQQQTPTYYQTEVGGTKIVMTTQIPALKHNRIETGLDWEKFGSAVRSFEGNS